MRRPESQFATPRALSAAKALGASVRAKRLTMNSTQADFCARARISRATLARIESGDAAVSFAAWLSALEEASLLHLLESPGAMRGEARGVATARAELTTVPARQRASGAHGASARADAYDF